MLHSLLFQVSIILLQTFSLSPSGGQLSPEMPICTFVPFNSFPRSLEPLHSSMINLLNNGLAPATRQSYSSGARSYVSFCVQNNIVVFPIADLTLCRFFTRLFNRHITYATMRVYLAGIQYQNSILGFTTQPHELNTLHWLFQGIRQTQGSVSHRPPRAPVTFADLYTLLIYITESSYSAHDRALLRSTCLLAFFAMLRASDFTTSTVSTFDPTVSLLPQDITFNNSSMMLVYIKASKTDPFRAGIYLRISPLNNRLCPVTAMRQFLFLRGSRVGPLYMFESGIYLTRCYLTNLLRQALIACLLIITHIVLGLAVLWPHLLLVFQMSWSASWADGIALCYIRCIRVSNDTLRDSHQNMLNSNTNRQTTVLFSPDAPHSWFVRYRTI